MKITIYWSDTNVKPTVYKNVDAYNLGDDWLTVKAGFIRSEVNVTEIRYFEVIEK